jgi:hypothetical protein
MNQDTNRPLVLPPGEDEFEEHFLRFLFVAEFEDGSQLAQTHEDASQFDPSKSAFFDVLKYSESKKLTRFHLTDKLNWYTVDLRDGLFEVNGMAFAAHPQYFVPNPPLTLIYFRETRAEKLNDGTERHYVNRYFLGWWCLGPDGAKVEQTIAIK